MNVKYFNMESFLILISCVLISYLYVAAGYVVTGKFSFNYANSFSFAVFVFFLNAAVLTNSGDSRREPRIIIAFLIAGALFGAVLIVNSGLSVFFCELVLVYACSRRPDQKFLAGFSAGKTFYRFILIFFVFFTAFYINSYGYEIIYVSSFSGVTTIVLHTRDMFGILILALPVFLFYAAFYLARDMALGTGTFQYAAGKRRCLAIIFTLYAVAYIFLILTVILKFAGSFYLVSLLSAPRVYAKYKKFAASRGYSEPRLVFLNILTLNNFCLPAMALALFFNR